MTIAAPLVYIQQKGFTQKFENNANGQPVYVGQARPGTATSADTWSICAFTYDSKGAVTDIKWADSTADFIKQWDDRATYTYA